MIRKIILSNDINIQDGRVPPFSLLFLKDDDGNPLNIMPIVSGAIKEMDSVSMESRHAAVKGSATSQQEDQAVYFCTLVSVSLLQLWNNNPTVPLKVSVKMLKEHGIDLLPGEMMFLYDRMIRGLPMLTSIDIFKYTPAITNFIQGAGDDPTRIESFDLVAINPLAEVV